MLILCEQDKLCLQNKIYRDKISGIIKHFITLSNIFRTFVSAFQLPGAGLLILHAESDRHTVDTKRKFILKYRAKTQYKYIFFERKERNMKKLALILCVILCLAALSMSVFAADGSAQYANVKPVIDGEIDDAWSVAPALESTYPGDAEGEGISGYAKLLWDEEYIYFLAFVDDATLDEANQKSSNSVDLWFSETNSADPDGYPKDGDWALTVSPYGTSADFYYIGNAAVYDKTECATKLTDTGYIVEAKVSYITADLKPVTGHIAGFNISFNNDLDNDGQRDSWISWQPYESLPYWANTASLWTVEFAGQKVETAAPETEAPAADQATAPVVTAAAQTFDAFTIAAAIMAVSLAGTAFAKKRS